MKNTLLFILLLLTTNILAQTPSSKKSPFLIEGNPETVGMSKSRLERIDNMCMESIKNDEIPGAVYLVARNGVIVSQKAFGQADNGQGKQMEIDAIFRIASQSKAITSTAIMMLWEEGKFQLDDPISKFIPAFANPIVLDSLLPDGTYETHPADNEITIRHLITHTSGLGYGEIDSDPRFKEMYKNAGITDLFTTKDITIRENVLKLAKLPLHHNPGEKFTYSEGVDVIGYLIEVISGKLLDEFLKKSIFDPLGMKDTRFYLPDAKHDRLVRLQKKINNNWKPMPVTFYDPDFPIKGAKKFFSGGAGLCSTVLDYAQFLQMYLNMGELNGTRLLSRTTVEFILKNQVGDLWNGAGVNYGLAFGITNQKGHDRGGKGSVGSYEWGGYFNTTYFVDPKEKLIGVLMKQTMDAKDDATVWKFRHLVLQAIDD